MMIKTVNVSINLLITQDSWDEKIEYSLERLGRFVNEPER